MLVVILELSQFMMIHSVIAKVVDHLVASWKSCSAALGTTNTHSDNVQSMNDYTTALFSVYGLPCSTILRPKYCWIGHDSGLFNLPPLRRRPGYRLCIRHNLVPPGDKNAKYRSSSFSLITNDLTPSLLNSNVITFSALRRRRNRCRLLWAPYSSDLVRHKIMMPLWQHTLCPQLSARTSAECAPQLNARTEQVIGYSLPQMSRCFRV